MATQEELMAQGFDAETAQLLAEAQSDGSGGSLPFPVMKFSYDQEDILIDEGVKKGNIISGYKIDKATLTMKEAGTDHGNKVEFVVVASVFQNSHYDIQTTSTDVITDIFYSPFDSAKMVDKKSGMTIKAIKDAGGKVKFTNILLLLVKEGKEWKPYIHYMHGTNYHNFYVQLDEAGVKDLALNYVIKAETKRVPTTHQPAWVFDVQSATERTADAKVKAIPEVSAAMKEFNAWVKASNSGEVAKPREVVETTEVGAGQNPEIDINEDEIPF